jgi:small subunit ribosomal protein S8
MNISDPIGDMFARIKNAQSRNHSFVLVPFSNFKGKILDVMLREGFIEKFEVVKEPDSKHNFLSVTLKYVKGSPVIREISRISKPGRRIYSRSDTLPQVLKGLGVSIVSTSKGLFTDEEAREKKLGGEIICNIS